MNKLSEKTMENIHNLIDYAGKNLVLNPTLMLYGAGVEVLKNGMKVSYPQYASLFDIVGLVCILDFKAPPSLLFGSFIHIANSIVQFAKPDLLSENEKAFYTLASDLIVGVASVANPGYSVVLGNSMTRLSIDSAKFGI